MQLPGGLLKNGRLNQHFSLNQPGGDIDFALHHLTTKVKSHPDWVDQALLLILETLANDEPTLQDVQSLCVADRQAIAIAWQLSKSTAPLWLTIHCHACDNPIDVCIPVAELPFSKAGKHFPFAKITVNKKSIKLRVPNGSDLSAIAQLPEAEAVQCLAQRLIAQPSSAPTTQSIPLNKTTIQKIERAVEQQVPELATDINCECPECDAKNLVHFDPYQGLVSRIDELLDEVHLIASAYHWTEQEILQLPNARRKDYLKRISRDRHQPGEWL